MSWKMVPILIVGIAVGAISVYYAHPVLANLNLQKQCASDAQGFFGDWQNDPSLSNDWAQTITSSGGQASYTSHYNTSLNECLIEINGHQNPADSVGSIQLPAGASTSSLNINNLPAGTTVLPPPSFDLTWLYNVYGKNMLAYLNMDSSGNIAMCQFPAHDNEANIQFPGMTPTAVGNGSTTNYCANQAEFQNVMDVYMSK